MGLVDSSRFLCSWVNYCAPSTSSFSLYGFLMSFLCHTHARIHGPCLLMQQWRFHIIAKVCTTSCEYWCAASIIVLVLMFVEWIVAVWYSCHFSILSAGFSLLSLNKSLNSSLFLFVHFADWDVSWLVIVICVARSSWMLFQLSSSVLCFRDDLVDIAIAISSSNNNLLIGCILCELDSRLVIPLPNSRWC